MVRCIASLVVSIDADVPINNTLPAMAVTAIDTKGFNHREADAPRSQNGAQLGHDENIPSGRSRDAAGARRFSTHLIAPRPTPLRKTRVQQNYRLKQKPVNQDARPRAPLCGRRTLSLRQRTICAASIRTPRCQFATDDALQPRRLKTKAAFWQHSLGHNIHGIFAIPRKATYS